MINPTTLRIRNTTKVRLYSLKIEWELAGISEVIDKLLKDTKGCPSGDRVKMVGVTKSTKVEDYIITSLNERRKQWKSFSADEVILQMINDQNSSI
ncbi:MAG: hypothetical protein DRG30_07155 [Epsilonproteobacteria bacterium]|nr:MAG: hypothetical protein DRG30_07155 [Campylobacterota bacterium]